MFENIKNKLLKEVYNVDVWIDQLDDVLSVDIKLI